MDSSYASRWVYIASPMRSPCSRGSWSHPDSDISDIAFVCFEALVYTFPHTQYALSQPRKWCTCVTGQQDFPGPPRYPGMVRLQRLRTCFCFLLPIYMRLCQTMNQLHAALFATAITIKLPRCRGPR